MSITGGIEATQPSAALPVRGLVMLAISVVLLSSAWPLTKIALQHGATPLWFAEGRAVLSCLTAVLLLIPRQSLRLPRRGDLIAVLAIGALQLAGFFILTHEAVAWVAAGRTAVLANTTTIFVVPLSLLLLGEPIPFRRWLAAILGLIGIVVLMGPWSIDWSKGHVLIGHAFLLGAAFCWSLAIIAVRRFRPVSSMFVLLPWCFAVCSVLLLPVVMVHAPDGTLGWSPVGWASLAYIGFVAGPIGTWAVMEAMAILPGLVSSIGFLATPAVGLLLSNLLLGEPFTPDLIGGTALILGGVACAAWPGGRRR